VPKQKELLRPKQSQSEDNKYKKKQIVALLYYQTLFSDSSCAWPENHRLEAPPTDNPS
jgi:hypothetical protein|tara:strand:- start:515 stop:688 length:174 start_codon:yes stop_codon:yes gene_type:complete